MPVDNAGNTTATARNLGTLTATAQTFTDWVGDTDDNDYYRFTLSNASNLRLNLTGLSADADLYVYAANGTTLLRRSSNIGNANETVNLDNLAAGNYYVRVLPLIGETNYSLSIAAPLYAPADAAGNTIATARNLGTLSATAQTFTDWVGTAADVNDYYRFTLGSASNLQVNLTGLSTDADVYVYAANGTTLLGRGSNVGNADETVTIGNLAPGTCYVRVLPLSGNTNYGLSVAALPLAPPADLAGNTLATARNIGILTATTQTFKDRIGNADNNDFYRFTLSGTSDVRLNITGLSADANVLVYAANGTTVLGTGANTGITSEAVAINRLAAGTYYARVYPGVATANTNYSLAISGQLTDLAGNTVATARTITTALSATAQTFTDWVGTTDSSDYYRFTLANAGNLQLNLTGMRADADLTVYAANGTTVLASSENAGSANETLSLNNLAAGSYYALVNPFNGDTTSYSLSMAVLPIPMPDFAGSTTATARNLGSLSTTTQSVRDWVGSTDTNDYYTFTLNSVSGLQVNLTGLSADANVVVYASNGTTVVGTGANTGITSEAVSINNLAAGTYYARVYPGVATANTNYTLALAALPPDNSGNTIATARNVGALTATTRTFSDWVGSVDSNDYYGFTLSNLSNLSLNLTGLAADANVQVYAADGTTVLRSGANTGATSEVVSINDMAAGTYYARVYPGVATANTNYTLTLSASIADYAGNTIDTARNIGTLGTSSRTFSDRVGSTDTDDYYRFTLSSARDVRVGLSGLSANADVVVYDSGNTAWWGGILHSGSTSEALDINNLAAGDYYVRVYPGDATANTNYSLTLTATGVAATDDAGSSTATARNLGTLPATSSLLVRDHVDGSDSGDYYTFTLDATRNVYISLTGMSDNANLWLYDANDGWIAYSNNNSSTNDALNVATLAPGTYSLAVGSVEDTTSYPDPPSYTSTDYTLGITTTIPGGSTENMVLGGIGNDDLLGSEGNDTLFGDVGYDTLYGWDGADMFRFVITTTSNVDDVDSITDFQSGTDKIQVITPNFTNLPIGILGANNFVIGNYYSGSAPLFIYDRYNGTLSFDSDGTGSAASVYFATLTGSRSTLVASDIQVIAA